MSRSRNVFDFAVLFAVHAMTAAHRSVATKLTAHGMNAVNAIAKPVRKLWLVVANLESCQSGTFGVQTAARDTLTRPPPHTFDVVQRSPNMVFTQGPLSLGESLGHERYSLR